MCVAIEGMGNVPVKDREGGRSLKIRKNEESIMVEDAVGGGEGGFRDHLGQGETSSTNALVG